MDSDKNTLMCVCVCVCAGVYLATKKMSLVHRPAKLCRRQNSAVLFFFFFNFPVLPGERIIKQTNPSAFNSCCLRTLERGKWGKHMWSIMLSRSNGKK